VVLLAITSAPALAAQPEDRAALEAQLRTARAQLDEAAREVAELSRQLYGGEGQPDFLRFVRHPPQGAMLGINIEDTKTRDDGVAIAGVSPGGPAERAGLRSGDIVTAMNGRALRASDAGSPARQLVEQMRGVTPGEAVKLDYLRDGAKRSVVVEAAPAEPPIMRIVRERLPMGFQDGSALPDLGALIGPQWHVRSFELVPVTPKLGRYFGTDAGLLVVRAPAAQGWPLEEGDVLLSVDGRTPDSPGHAFRILGSFQPGEKVKLGVLRDRRRLELEATVPAAAEVLPPLHRAPVAPPAGATARPT
jgi:S1-C subfamily serine protease